MTETFEFYDLGLANAKFEELRIEGAFRSNAKYEELRAEGAFRWLVYHCSPILVSATTREICLAVYTITVTR